MEWFDRLIMPWSDDQMGDTVLSMTCLLLLIALIPLLFLYLNQKTKERTFNHYLQYVAVVFMPTILAEFLFWPLAMLLGSLFLIALFDTGSAKEMCYRERNGLDFRVWRSDACKNGRRRTYSKEDLKPYLPNPILFCTLLYGTPLLALLLFYLLDLGYLFWV